MRREGLRCKRLQCFLFCFLWRRWRCFQPYLALTHFSQVLGIKLLVRRLLGREKLDSDEDRPAVAKPSLRLLNALVESSGELLSENATTP
jgi:hypothetical protein